MLPEGFGFFYLHNIKDPAGISAGIIIFHPLRGEY